VGIAAVKIAPGRDCFLTGGTGDLSLLPHRS
jgi:hypothetical protein